MTSERGAPLFRREAYEHARSGGYGSVVLTRSTSQRVIVSSFALCAVSIVGFTLFAPYTSNLQVSGVLVPIEKPIRVDAAETLTVLESNLTTGARVEVGQIMLIAVPSVGNTDENRADEAAQDVRPMVIRAPRRGVVSAVNVVPGQRVAGNTNLAVIQPAGPLEAQADVPMQAFGTLQRGEVLHLRYRAFPYERFGRFAASVDWFRLVPADGTRLPAMFDYSAEGVSYRVGLRLTEQSPADGGGKKLPLAAGMRFDTTIPIETRPIYRWLFNFGTNANG